MNLRHTWTKAEKLKSRKRIDRVFKEGRNFSVFPFKVFYLLTPAPPDGHSSGAAMPDAAAAGAAPNPRSRTANAPVQAGFGAGSRHFKKAVDRNRIKRLCREAWRQQKNPLVDQLRTQRVSMAVFFVYIGKDLPDYQTVTGKIGVILKKLLKETA